MNQYLGASTFKKRSLRCTITRNYCAATSTDPAEPSSSTSKILAISGQRETSERQRVTMFCFWYEKQQQQK